MLKQLVIGHLGKDAIVNRVNNNTVINFSVAHTESYKDQAGNKVSSTTWVECAYWTDRTAIAPYLTKGTQVFVDGLPSVDTYTNQQGKVTATMRLRVQSVQLLGSANKDGQSQQQQPQRQQATAADYTDAADDLPF